MDRCSERLNQTPLGNLMVDNDVSMLSVVVQNFISEHTNENYESDYTLKLFLDKMQQLEAAWTDNERKLALFQAENEQLHMQLLNEKNKSTVLQNQVQFIQEHKGHLQRLKEVYSKMKQMDLEKCQSSRINIHKATQSESIMTVSSYTSCIMQSEITEKNDLPRESSSFVSVRKVELSKAQDTINVLKQLIFRREQMWGFNREKQKQFMQNVQKLEKENASLRSIVRTHYERSMEHIGTAMENIISHTSSISVEVNAVQPTESVSTNTMDNCLIEVKGIVSNLEDNNNELEENVRERSCDSTSKTFNQKERVVFKQLADLNVPPNPKSSIHISRKYPSKSAISAVERNRNRSIPPPRRSSGSVFTSIPQYPPHPKCNDRRCQDSSYSVTGGPSHNKRTEKPRSRTGKINVQLPPLILKPGSREDTELEILSQIKDEIMKKQQTITNKLELFQHGLVKRKKKMGSKHTTPNV